MAAQLAALNVKGDCSRILIDLKYACGTAVFGYYGAELDAHPPGEDAGFVGRFDAGTRQTVRRSLDINDRCPCLLEWCGDGKVVCDLHC